MLHRTDRGRASTDGKQSPYTTSEGKSAVASVINDRIISCKGNMVDPEKKPLLSDLSKVQKIAVAAAEQAGGDPVIVGAVGETILSVGPARRSGKDAARAEHRRQWKRMKTVVQQQTAQQQHEHQLKLAFMTAYCHNVSSLQQHEMRMEAASETVAEAKARVAAIENSLDRSRYLPGEFKGGTLQEAQCRMRKQLFVADRSYKMKCEHDFNWTKLTKQGLQGMYTCTEDKHWTRTGKAVVYCDDTVPPSFWMKPVRARRKLKVKQALVSGDARQKHADLQFNAMFQSATWPHRLHLGAATWPM